MKNYQVMSIECLRISSLQQFCPSYGECSVYISEATICDDVLRPGIDFVYARSKLGHQSTISQLLNEKINDAETFIGDNEQDCVKQVFRVLCHFYLPPCGNSTHPVPPSSICKEQCQIVQNKCQKTWLTLFLAFRNVNPIIQCNDTSRLLFPVPHCCMDAGLGLSFHLLHSTIYQLANHTVGSSQDKGSSSNRAVVGIVIGVVMFILIAAAAIAIPFITMAFSNKHRKKQFHNMQLDILAV